LANEISKKIPFSINYDPDFRQAIADSWPSLIDDSAAQKDWNWQLEYGLEKMVEIMLENVNSEKLFGKSSIKTH
jgi:hypothetical protein